MEYLMYRHRSMMELLAIIPIPRTIVREITDSTGAVQFTVRVRMPVGGWSLTSPQTLLDSSGHEVAVIRRHVATSTHEVYMAGRRVAEVRHKGILHPNENYSVESEIGPLTCEFSYWSGGARYYVSRDGRHLARMHREGSAVLQLGLPYQQQFEIELADGENQGLLLALLLAVEDIEQGRENQQANGRFRQQYGYRR